MIATSSLELSQPRPPSSSGRGTVRPPMRKAWELVVQERLEAKTRIISKVQPRNKVILVLGLLSHRGVSRLLLLPPPIVLLTLHRCFSFLSCLVTTVPKVRPLTPHTPSHLTLLIYYIGTLDLLGQDSLLLGNLLYTLGTIMYAASNTPISPAMGVALLDFTWALRYHTAV